MARIEETIDLTLGAEDAYGQWLDFEAFSLFMRSVERVIRTGDGAHHWVVKIAGRRREFDTRITSDDPGKRVAWEGTGDMPHSGVMVFTPIDNGNTRMSVSIDWQPGSVVQKAGHRVGSDHREVRNELWRFKDFVESGGTLTHHGVPEHGLGSHDYFGGTAGGGFPPGVTELPDIPMQDPAAAKDQPGGHGEMGEASPRHRAADAAGARGAGPAPEAARDPEGGATGR
jgi:hypothetical protein